MAKFCTNCGNEIDENADYCLNCGKQINNISSQTVNNYKSNDLIKKIIIHSVLFVFTMGIGNIIYLIYCNNKKKKIRELNNLVKINVETKFSNNNDSNFDEIYERQEARMKRIEYIENKYKDVLEEHFSLNEKIGYQYTIAINQDTLINEETGKCIKLCEDDISLAEKIKEYFEEWNEIQGYKKIPSYPSFKTLAQLYEKMEDYYSAINVCISSIKLGYVSDGTKGGMQGRLAKLIKKYNEFNNKNIQYDYEQNILFDKDTGEIIN